MDTLSQELTAHRGPVALEQHKDWAQRFCVIRRWTKQALKKVAGVTKRERAALQQIDFHMDRAARVLVSNGCPPELLNEEAQK